MVRDRKITPLPHQPFLISLSPASKCGAYFFAAQRTPARYTAVMRLIAIDYGLKRTGIALGDTESRLALPFEVFEKLTDGQLAEAIGQLVRKEAIDAVVVGMPLHADGSVSGQSKLTERFILGLVQVLGPKVPLHRWSEYLSTHSAEGKLAGHYTRNQKRARVDALAAAGILQDWLDSQPKTSG
jgi:putative Holliday junction resolvase